MGFSLVPVLHKRMHRGIAAHSLAHGCADKNAKASVPSGNRLYPACRQIKYISLRHFNSLFNDTHNVSCFCAYRYTDSSSRQSRSENTPTDNWADMLHKCRWHGYWMWENSCISSADGCPEGSARANRQAHFPDSVFRLECSKNFFSEMLASCMTLLQ